MSGTAIYSSRCLPKRVASATSAPEILLGVDKLACGGSQVKYRQRHCYSEDALAQSGKSFDALSGDLVVAELLPMRVFSHGDASICFLPILRLRRYDARPQNPT